MVVNPADGTVADPDRRRVDPQHRLGEVDHPRLLQRHRRVANKTSSRYITQVDAIEQQILSSLPATAPANAAIVFDVDDTLLWNYDFEDQAPTSTSTRADQRHRVPGKVFLAVPGMPQLLRDLRGPRLRALRRHRSAGRASRPPPSRTSTRQGFTDRRPSGGTPLFNAAPLHQGPGPAPAVRTSRGSTATPTAIPPPARRSSTRRLRASHIESADGVNIVHECRRPVERPPGRLRRRLDQDPEPDLLPGLARHRGAPASDAGMVPPTSYVMQPDGSSGYSVASGDDIPNIDPVRKMIRAYYNADRVRASRNKTTSPYITQLTSLESTWTAQVTCSCTTASHGAQRRAGEADRRGGEGQEGREGRQEGEEGAQERQDPGRPQARAQEARQGEEGAQEGPGRARRDHRSGQPAAGLRRRRHDAVDLRHGGRGDEVRLRPGPRRTPGSPVTCSPPCRGWSRS